MRPISALCAVAALIALGLALNSTGIQYISECSTAIRGPFRMVLIGIVAFLGLAILSVRQDRRSAYLLLVGIAGLVVFHDWVQGQTTEAALAMNCPEMRL